jgi:hypothetical protein
MLITSADELEEQIRFRPSERTVSNSSTTSRFGRRDFRIRMSSLFSAFALRRSESRSALSQSRRNTRNGASLGPVPRQGGSCPYVELYIRVRRIWP